MPNSRREWSTANLRCASARFKQNSNSLFYFLLIFWRVAMSLWVERRHSLSSRALCLVLSPASHTCNTRHNDRPQQSTTTSSRPHIADQRCLGWSLQLARVHIACKSLGGAARYLRTGNLSAYLPLLAYCRDAPIAGVCAGVPTWYLP